MLNNCLVSVKVPVSVGRGLIDIPPFTLVTIVQIRLKILLERFQKDADAIMECTTNVVFVRNRSYKTGSKHKR